MSENVENYANGYENNEISRNGMLTATGDIRKANEFYGGTHYVDLGSDLISTKAVTISAWVYTRSNGGLGNGRILDNGSTVLKIPNTDRLAFSSDGLGTEAVSAAGSLQLHTWTHVVVSRKSSGMATFYINGSLSGTANQQSGTPVAGIGHVSIGNGTPNQRSDVGWDGLIDEVRIYDRVLTEEEIKCLYDMHRGTVGSLASSSL
jgi:hypothetical protein